MEKNRFELNDRASQVVEDLLADPEGINVIVHEIADATVVDCGLETSGSLRAARLVAETCLADQAEVSLSLDRINKRPCSKITIAVDEPVGPCLLSQYAGWKVQLGDFFAMCSGPIRAAFAREPIFQRLDYSEDD